MRPGAEPRPLPLRGQRRPSSLPADRSTSTAGPSSSPAACPGRSCWPTTTAAKRASTSSASTSRTTPPPTTASTRCRPRSSDDGAVGSEPQHRYWPSNPWDHHDMTQRADHGSFSYAVAADRHFVHAAPAPRSQGRLRAHGDDRHQPLAAAADQPGGRDPAPQRAHPRRLRRPVGAAARRHAPHGGRAGPGHRRRRSARTPTGRETRAAATPCGRAPAPARTPTRPATPRRYTLTVHLHSGDFQAGGTAPSPAAPARSAGSPES